MSNFTRSGRRAKIWQSITNLSCCSIDLKTKQFMSMKALAFIMLFAFSTSSIYAQDLERSTFFNRCLSDAPPGPSEADVANLYLNQCGTIPAQVIKTPHIEGNDCAWTVEYTYDVKCGDFEEQIKIDYQGGDLTPPELNGDTELPTGGTNLNLCYDAIPAGPSVSEVAALYSDNCSDVFVTKSGTPEGGNCQWTVTYKYTIQDACGNMAADLDITYSGGDTEAPSLLKEVEIPTGQTGLNLCFEEKMQGPTVEDIAALFEDNCGLVTVQKEEYSKGTDCKWMAQYTYTIKDDCNNYAEPIVLIYSGGDTEAPVLEGVPGDITVDCIDLIPEPDTKSIVATDNCTEYLEVVVSDDDSQLGDACSGGVLIRTYTATDNCDYSTSETQTITVLPTPEATLSVPSFPSNITCEAAADFSAPDATYNNGVQGGACAVSGSIVADINVQYTECGGTITVSYDGLDSCDRPLSAGPYTITVDPAPQAEFEAVQDMEITCEEANVYEPSSLSYTNGGTGLCEISGSVPGELSGSYTYCGGTLYVDWTFTDECQRTITAQKVITVLPAPEAEFDEILDMEITCEEANVYEPSSLSYTNGGTGVCEISGSVPGELSGSYTECGGTLYVDWTFTDECNRTITAKKTITVLPAPQAEFDEIANASIQCEDLASYEPEFLSYTNGGTGACEISGSVQGEAEPFDGSCGTFEVNFTFTDDCGRTITASQTITVIDETAPVLVGELPQGESNLDLCFDNRPEGPTVEEIAALFQDNCGNVNVTKTVSAPQEDDCHWAVMYRYEIQDDCGNFANPVKVFYNGGDISAPVLTGELPQGTTGLQCLSENPGAPSVDAITAAYTDNCGTVTVTPLEPVIEGDDCGWTATYEFTIVDACNNYAENLVIVNSGADTMPPVLEGEVPMGQNTLDLCADSDLGEPSEEEIAALYADNCSAVTVTKVEKLYGTDCEWIRVFEYTAKDACGNEAELIKVNYQGGDNSAPAPTGACDNETMIIGTEMGAVCPAEASISLQVGDEISAGDNSWSVAGLTVAQMNGTLVPCFADNCAEVEELTFRVIAKSTAQGDCSTTLTVTFEVEDLCENVSEPFTCTFVVVDDTAPVVECPEGQDFGLVAETPTSFADKAPYTDNCQADGQTQDFSDNLTSEVTDGVADEFTILCYLNGSIHSTWDYTLREIDANGYPIYDALFVPEFPNETSVISYNVALGRYEMDAYNNGSIYADNIWYSVTDSNTVPCAAEEWVVSNQFCTLEFECDDSVDQFETFTLVRTFTANDGCDNTATCDVTYTWSVLLTPENDTCANATPIACGDSVMGSTDYASQESDLPFCDTNLNTSPGVWYVLEGTGDILDVTADTFGSDYDTKLGVFEGSCDALVCVTGDDDASNPFSLQSQVFFQSEVGVDYYIYVSGFGGNTGEYMLTVACEVLTPCDVADELACGDVVTGDTSVDGMVALDGQSCVSAANAIGEWYTFIGTGQAVTLSTCSANTTYDTYLSAYTDCGTTCVTNNDDAGNTVGCTHSFFHSTIEFDTVEGQEYNIFVSGWVSSFSGPKTGAYELSVECEADLGTIVECGGAGETVSVANYGNNEFLEWTFTSSTGDALFIDLDGITEGGYDFIDIYDGLDASAPSLGSFSGNLAGQSVTTTGASVYIVFDSDGSVSGGSFTVDVDCPLFRQAAQDDVKIDFTAFPVPFDNEVNIAYSFEFQTNVTIELFDTKGLLVLSETNDRYVAGSNGKSTFDLSRYSNQLFYVKLTTSQGSVTKKIVSSGKK